MPGRPATGCVCSLSCEGPVHDTHLPFIVLIIHVTATPTSSSSSPNPPPGHRHRHHHRQQQFANHSSGWTVCSRNEAAFSVSFPARKRQRAVRVQQASSPQVVAFHSSQLVNCFKILAFVWPMTQLKIRSAADATMEHFALFLGEAGGRFSISAIISSDKILWCGRCAVPINKASQ